MKVIYETPVIIRQSEIKAVSVFLNFSSSDPLDDIIKVLDPDIF